MKRALIGAGGAAREIKAQIGDPEIKCFVDNEYWKENSDLIFPLSEFDPTEYEVIIAIGDSKSRFNMAQKLPKETQYFTFIHPSAIIIGNDVIIGKGSIISAGCILTNNIVIGEHAYLNIQSTISHDCRIGNFFTASPGVKILGNCLISDRVYIGACASVREKIKITEDVIIGLNAGIVKNIETPGTYTGVPAKKIK